MSFAASLLLSASLALLPGAGLRLYNPHDTAVEATVDCAGARRAVRVEANDTVDLAGCGTASIEAPLPLTALETAEEDGIETQRLLGTDASCESFAVEAPLFGCRLGTATVAVPSVPGAVYAWSVDGASVVSGHGTNRLVLTLGGGTSARVTATVTGACTSTAQAIISLRPALVIEKLDVPAAATANTPATIRWTYAAGLAPVSQLLSGDAFDAPVALGGDVRSYAWTPKTTGSKLVELRASYAPAIAVQGPKRRRSVGASRATAAECPAARASGRVQVGGCGALNVHIEAPESIEAGGTFTATIFLRAGETVRWSVENATILSGATADTVTVKAGDLPGELKLSAEVTAGPSCHETAQARVPVVERAVCATAAPTVALSVDHVGCDSATLRADFTGTPPFTGAWSDGVAFQTTAATLTHDVKIAATYTIRNFRDALCSGQVATTARVASIGPTASVSLVGGTCYPGTKAVALFTGKPPFTGNWVFGEYFSTDATSLETTDLHGGLAQIESFRDGDCPDVRKTSNAVAYQARTTAHLRDSWFCTTSSSRYVTLFVDVFPEPGVRPPFTVFWSDGTVIQGGIGDWSIRRDVAPGQPETEYELVRVAGTACDMILDPARTKAVVSYRATPHIDRYSYGIVGCLAEPATIRLEPGSYPPEAKLTWSVSKGEIISGQGTPEVTIRQDRLPGGTLTVEATYPDGRCASSDEVDTILQVRPTIFDFSVTPSTIQAGHGASVHASFDAQVEYAAIETIPSSRQSAISIAHGICTDEFGRDCIYPYGDEHGPGTVTLVLRVGNHCTTVSRSIELTIE